MTEPEIEINIDEVVGPAHLATRLRVRAVTKGLPVWIVHGHGRTLVTPDNVKGVCSGLLIAAEIAELKSP